MAHRPPKSALLAAAALLPLVAVVTFSCRAPSTPNAQAPQQHDLILTGGTVFDGTGKNGEKLDLAIDADKITAIGPPGSLGPAKQSLDVHDLAVAPGFINMLSQAVDSFFADGRGLSDLVQGVTTEIVGEGESPGPLTQEMKKEWLESQVDVKYPITWTTLGEYFDVVQGKGISMNLGSFVGAATIRLNVLGHDKRAPNAEELARMQALVGRSMDEGALGVSSALIYEPGLYATTDELVALASAAKPHDGLYISHMRSEGDRLLEGIEELITIAKRSGVRAEIYHFKAAGEDNWGKIDKAIAKVEAARAEGLEITADMYPYTAAASGLDVAMPPWVREGGYEAWRTRLRDPAIRERVVREMRKKGEGWENFWYGSRGNVLALAFKNPSLKRFTGLPISEISKIRGSHSPEDEAIDLVIENGSRVEVAYFLMYENAVKRVMMTPWVSFCSDAEAVAPIQPFLRSQPHPRAYGTFARVLSEYTSDEGWLKLPDAIRKMTSLPAHALRLDRRGEIKVGNFADIVVFDPKGMRSPATYEKPHQLAKGVRHVIVNGELALFNRDATQRRPGRVLRHRRTK